MFGGFVDAMFVLVPIVMVGMVVLAVVLGVKGFRDGKRRQEAIAATVAAHHLGHLTEDLARVSFFSSPPFGIGKRRRARDIVWGTLVGRAFETFAYSYETEHQDADGHTHTTTHRFQVTWVPLPAALPTVRITGDNPLLRAMAKLGAKDLEVESHEFNQRWKVWCEDERIGHAILTPTMIERLLAPDVAGRAFVFEGAALFSYAPQVTDLAELPLVVGALYDLVDRVPGFLLENPREPSA